MPRTYTRLTGKTIAELADIVGVENIITAKSELEKYASDEAPLATSHLPQVVVKPLDTRTVSRLFLLAPLIPPAKGNRRPYP